MSLNGFYFCFLLLQCRTEFMATCFLSERNVSICQITETLNVFPFNSNNFFSFRGTCDHYLLRSCDDRLSNVSVTVDFLSNNIGSARVGVQYGDSSIISTATGNVVFKNLIFIRQDGNAQIYSNGFVLYRENGMNRIVIGPTAVTHRFSGVDRSIQLAVSNSAASMATCGLCGTIDGTLLKDDLQRVTDIRDQIQMADFIEGKVVEPSKQYLRGQRRECGNSMVIRYLQLPSFFN